MRARFPNATPKPSPAPSSIVKRALERMDAMLSETGPDGAPHTTGDAMVHALVHTARALAANPVPLPPGS